MTFCRRGPLLGSAQQPSRKTFNGRDGNEEYWTPDTAARQSSPRSVALIDPSRRPIERTRRCGAPSSLEGGLREQSFYIQTAV